MQVLDPVRRKLAAKKNNERVKLAAGALNALALGIVGAAVILPITTSLSSILDSARLIWFVFGFALHLTAHAVFAFLKSED